MSWRCGEEKCVTHEDPGHRHAQGRWYCGRVRPACEGHPTYGEQCPEVEDDLWTCGARDCPMNHSQPSHHCREGLWYCGRINPRCNGHRSWQPHHRHGPDAILLLDGNIEAAWQAFEHSMNFSDRRSLLFALRAYYNFKAVNAHLVTQPYLFFVDFGLASKVPRGIVFNMISRTVHAGPFTVAHGEGSGANNSVPMVFSNVQDSYQTSLGLYVTAEPYDFGNYNTRAVRLDGHSIGFNDRARPRGIVMHPAPYVGSANAGRSQGCPAVPMSHVALIDTLAHGSVVFHFSPHDNNWLDHEKWVLCRGYPATNSTRTR